MNLYFSLTLEIRQEQDDAAQPSSSTSVQEYFNSIYNINFTLSYYLLYMRRSKAEWTIPLLVCYEKSGKIEVKVRDKGVCYLCFNLEGGISISLDHTCLFSCIKIVLEYRGLSAKMRFVDWSTLLLNASYRIYIYIYGVYASGVFKDQFCIHT